MDAAAILIVGMGVIVSGFVTVNFILETFINK